MTEEILLSCSTDYSLAALNILLDQRGKDHYYPKLSGFLRTDVSYEGGQIDAILDFGSYIIIFEFKHLRRRSGKNSSSPQRVILRRYGSSLHPRLLSETGASIR